VSLRGRHGAHAGALEGVADLVAKVFEQAGVEGWQAECVEAFDAVQGELILERIAESGSAELMALAERFAQDTLSAGD